MGVETRIAWASHSFNPWRGCTKVSEGCANCYAEALSKRNHAVLGEWGDDGVRAMAAESAWAEVLRWDRAAAKAGERRRVFFSLGDPFEDRPELEPVRDRLLGYVVATPHLDWLLLTKRPENVGPYFDRLNKRRRGYWHEHFGYLFEASGLPHEQWRGVVDAYGVGGEPKCLGDSSVSEWPIPNLWLGVSCENQKRADERIPLLLQIPAAVRFVSAEPLLGPIDFYSINEFNGTSTDSFDALYGYRTSYHYKAKNKAECSIGVHGYPYNRLDWVIVGGESGPKRRECEVEWIADIARQCHSAGVPVFVKQDSGPRDGMQGRIPDDLWNLKQFPGGAR